MINRKQLSYLILFVPWFVLLFFFSFVMVGYNFFISFTDWQGIYPSFNLVGLQNYINMIRSSGFLITLKNTFVLFLVGLPITVLLSLIFAICMDIASPKVSRVLRSVAIASMALGGVTVASYWSLMFTYKYGGINQLLHAINLDNWAIDWLGNPKLVLFSVIIMLIWKFFGYAALVLLGGLQGIPDSHIEAARIDGATTVQLYTRVLLPQITGHIFTITLLLSMYLLKAFDYVYVLTGGGPGWASTIFPVLVYRKMFSELDYAGGAAAGTFVFILVSFIAVPYILKSNQERIQ